MPNKTRVLYIQRFINTCTRSARCYVGNRLRYYFFSGPHWIDMYTSRTCQGQFQTRMLLFNIEMSLPKIKSKLSFCQIFDIPSFHIKHIELNKKRHYFKMCFRLYIIPSPIPAFTWPHCSCLKRTLCPDVTFLLLLFFTCRWTSFSYKLDLKGTELADIIPWARPIGPDRHRYTGQKGGTIRRYTGSIDPP